MRPRKDPEGNLTVLYESEVWQQRPSSPLQMFTFPCQFVGGFQFFEAYAFLSLMQLMASFLFVLITSSVVFWRRPANSIMPSFKPYYLYPSEHKITQ